jgi:hypothetical protein
LIRILRHAAGVHGWFQIHITSNMRLLFADDDEIVRCRTVHQLTRATGSTKPSTG